MTKPPRDPQQKVMRGAFVRDFLVMGLVIGACVTGAFLYTVLQDGWDWGMPTNIRYPHAMTVGFTTLVFVQLINVFSTRSATRSVFAQNPFSNLFLVMSVLTSVLMVLLMVYVPALNVLLKTVPLTVTDWGVVVLASLVPLVVIEGRKRAMNKKMNGM